MEQKSPSILAINRAVKSGLRPETKLTVSEWSDQNRVLSQIASSEPGIWRTSRTPYLKEIMDVLSASDPSHEVVFMKGSQIGGSECGLNWIGYLIDHNPGPTMIIQPTDQAAKRFSRQRIDSMFRDTKKLQDKIRAKKSRDSSNTALMKEYDGGIMIITGANSASALRMMPIKSMFMDEIDNYPADVDGEGDPVELAQVRTRTFPKKKVFKNSSPTTEEGSRIKAAYEQSDKRIYMVPCPLCDFYQQILWANIKWEKGNPHTAHMVCVHCDGKIEESHKTKMLEKGKWVKQNPESSIAGFHLSALYSPLGWLSWAEAAKDFVAKSKDELKLRVFVNTVLAEPWKEKGDAPEWERLFERRELYKIGTVPKGGLFLTAGVDVQKDRFEVELVAWGSDKQSWSVDYQVFMGDTSAEKSYEELEKYLNRQWPVEGSKAKLPIRLMAIDSGFNTQSVYNFCRRLRGRVEAVKGVDTQQTLVARPTKQDVTFGGKTWKNGVRLWKVNASIAKSELYGWLSLKKPTQEGEPYPPCYCHFPQYSDEHFKMLTAEQIMVRIVKGFPKYEWHKVRERNEALDARVYARAAAMIVGLDRYTESDWKSMREALISEDDNSNVAEVNKTKGGIPIRNSEYW